MIILATLAHCSLPTRLLGDCKQNMSFERYCPELENTETLCGSRSYENGIFFHDVFYLLVMLLFLRYYCILIVAHSEICLFQNQSSRMALLLNGRLLYKSYRYAAS